MTKKNTEKHRYTVLDGKLCIEHYLLLQRLTYRKKLKNDEYKEYYSYHIKFPNAVRELFGNVDEVYLEKVDDMLLLHKFDADGFKKVRIQKTRKGDVTGYQLTIPRKLLDLTYYVPGETSILCQIVADDNEDGFKISFKLL